MPRPPSAVVGLVVALVAIYLAGVNPWAPAAQGLMLDPGPRLAGIQLLSYATVHASLGHVLTNCLALLVVGAVLARRLSGPVLVVLFWACAAAGGLAHVLACTLQGTDYVLAGASAGLYGLVGAWGRLVPRMRVGVGMLALAELVWALWQPLDGVGHWSHLGGLVAGSVLVPRVRPLDLGARG